MVRTRAMALGTGPKVQPPSSKPAQAKRATQAANLLSERETKKAAAKAEKDAIKAEAKAKKDAEKAAAKVAKSANSTKRTKSTKIIPIASTRTAKVAKVTKAAKVAKVAKVPKAPKTTKKAKVAKKISAVTVQPRANQYDESGDEPQSKRRKIEASALRRPYEGVSVPKAKRPDFQIGEWDYMRKTYIPEGLDNKNSRPLPHIYIGGTAPQPRWVVTQNEVIHLPVKRETGSNASSGSRPMLDFGGLQWTFEEGDFQKWTGLEYPALYEFAFLCLENTLNDTKVREQIYDSLANGPLPKEATKGNRWYPALPPIPITRHFVTGSSTQTSRKPSDATFYFGNYERPNMAVAIQPRDKRLAQLYPQAVASSLYNRSTSEGWPTAPRSASPDTASENGSEDGSEEDQSIESSMSARGKSYLQRNSAATLSEPTSTPSPQHEQSIEQNIKEDSNQDSDLDSEGGQSPRSRMSSVSGKLDLDLIQEGNYSEPTTPVSLANDEKNARLDTVSEDGSIFGDGDDDDSENDARVGPQSARDSREQPPNSILSDPSSDSEVSASSKTSEPRNFNVADDNSVQPTNSLTPIYHDGLFSPGQIDRYYSERNRVFEQESLGGFEHHEAPERKGQAQSSPKSKPNISGPIRTTVEKRSREREGIAESSKRNRVESPSTLSPPATQRRKTTAETGVDNFMTFAGTSQKQRNEMRAVAAEKVSDNPPAAPFKKNTPYRAGARSQADPPTSDIQPDLQDKFLEQNKAYLKDPIQRQKHFPDPLAIRRVRVWAGEELVGHGIKATVDAILPPWAERHRPFSQWQDPTGIAPGSAVRTKVSSCKKRSKGQSKRRPRPASAEEQSVSSARWSSFR